MTLNIGFFSYRVRLFVPPPMQCFCCQRIGHTVGGCKASKPRCLFCGGPHSVRDGTCIAQIPSCANCNGPHKANSYFCLYLKEAFSQNNGGGHYGSHISHRSSSRMVDSGNGIVVESRAVDSGSSTFSYYVIYSQDSLLVHMLLRY